MLSALCFVGLSGSFYAVGTLEASWAEIVTQTNQQPTSHQDLRKS